MMTNEQVHQFLGGIEEKLAFAECGDKVLERAAKQGLVKSVPHLLILARGFMEIRCSLPDEIPPQAAQPGLAE